jgi:hypothetical protein
MKTMPRIPASRVLAAVAAAAALTLVGCGLDDESLPALGGPSELGTALDMSATPDVLSADGFSTSLIQVRVFDQNGQTVANKAILLSIGNGDRNFVDLGTLYTPTGSLLRAAEAVVVTNASGVATAVYTAPPRPDFTSDGSVTINARPVGTDSNGSIYRFVRIELKSAEPRLFAGTSSCGFAVEAPRNAVGCSAGGGCTVKVGSQVLFQSTAIGVRFIWFWGDGTTSGDAPNQNHVFRIPGTFTVTHLVTDASGGQSACTATITVVP